MTTYSEAKNATTALFLQGWAAAAGEDGWELDPADAAGQAWREAAPGTGVVCPYTLDNESIDPPAGAAWARFTFRNGDRAQETMGDVGSRRFGSRARAFLEVFAVAGEGGTSAVDALVERGLSIFEGKRINGTTIRIVQCVPRERGIDRNERWWSSFLEIVLDYDEQK